MWNCTQECLFYFSEPIKRNIKSPFEDPEGDSNLEEDEEVDVPITNLNPNRSTSAISVGWGKVYKNNM